MGSTAYGVSDDNSDMDIYGWVIPTKELIFPHIGGEIMGFGKQIKRFEQWQHHHVIDHPKEYDFQVFNIVKYFQLCMECNPNMIDSMFTSQVSILHSTKIANMVREQRHLFLCKKAWHSFKGYAYSQLHKMNSKNPEGKRVAIREKFGFDVKFAYHLVRLLSEVEQILIEGDLDLQDKARREHMKAIRRGEVSKEDIIRWAADKEAQLEKLYHTSTLAHSMREDEIKTLLLNCLEEHFGDLNGCINEPDAPIRALREVDEVLKKYNRFL
jgi:predicted nucleotidyltransferase